MRKRYKLLVLSILLTALAFCYSKIEDRNAQLILREDEKPQMIVRTDDMEQTVWPWYDESEDILYFFLPSFVDTDTIYFDKIWGSGVEIDGEKYSWGGSFQWQAGKVYRFRQMKTDLTYRIAFEKSENLPALFVHTDSGSLEYLHENKEHQEQGMLAVIAENGNIGYHGRIDKLSGRGNSTWDSYKKPYSLTLPASYSLCGLEAGEKWYLLAMAYESDKIHSKMMYDMARQMGMEYAIESTWVDLYCNGEYQGLYLLTESVTVGDGRVEIEALEENDTDISGGYFLEKETFDAATVQEPYVCADYAMFIVRYPKAPTKEQLAYISGYMRWIEQMLLAKDPAYRDYVDVDSFADHLILENIALDADGMMRSTFFYKRRGSDKLYLGPVWDYDRAMGGGYPVEQYENSVFMVGMEVWYEALYADEYFRDTVTTRYQSLRPYLQWLLESGIDTYADEIRASAEMDRIMERAHKQTQDYDTAIEDLKEYFAGRLEYLDSLWAE